MRSNELRIGNHLKQGKITCLSNSLVDVDDTIYEIDEIHPIQLTEEWLLKFGFKLLRKDEFYDYTQIVYGKSIIKGDEDHSEKLMIYLPFNRCEIGEYNPREDDNSYLLNIDIDYVHQLQNLFHSLSGMEL